MVKVTIILSKIYIQKKLAQRPFFRTVLKNTVLMLTNRQQELLDYLRDYHSQTGLMPSTREIQHHFGFASQTAAVSHLRALEKKGVIQRVAGKARALVFPEELEREEIVDVPIYGHIAAGMAAEAEQQQEGCLSIDITSLGIPRNAKTFALRVRGDSMIDAHIVSGDCVVLEFRDPRNGDIVAALIDGETTLKRFILKDGQPYLQAENEMYPDLTPARELIIQGVMVALLRRGEGKVA
jgi:repressor LexA